MTNTITESCSECGTQLPLDELCSVNVPGASALLCPRCLKPCEAQSDLHERECQLVAGHTGPHFNDAQGLTSEWAEDKHEAMVDDGGPSEVITRADGSLSDPDFWRFTVPMTLKVTAASKAEALDKAMAWRDAVALSGDPSAALAALDVDWHLHHPWGC